VLEVIGEPGVAAIDDEVALVHEVGELGDGVTRRRPGRHHHPDDARSLEGLDHRGHGAHVGHLGVTVVPDDLVTGAAQALPHVAAHLAETDETELHG
jgi:hypothetical protein